MDTHTTKPAFAWSPKGWPSETAYATPDAEEVWCYTDRFSYLPGETVTFHLSASVPSFTVEITRDGLNPETVWKRDGVTAERHEAPADAYAAGCGWPVSLTLDVPDDWRPGFYIVTVRTVQSNGELWEREHYFVVKAAPERRPKMALVLTTGTMLAYNDWGGANHYRGSATTRATTREPGVVDAAAHRPRHDPQVAGAPARRTT